MINDCRVRFAPSPSGRMHLGNVRTAILNALCAQENNGRFILRIEDTDKQRTFPECLQAIYDDLKWLNLNPDESPLHGGEYGPYTQSQRQEVYQKYLDTLIEMGHAYKCFATKELLDRVRQAQIAAKRAPRYNRAVCALSEQEEREAIAQGKPFIWRFALPKGKTVIEDKARGQVVYDLANFADCPITREDGTFTFLFANFVDDVEMKISYVIRGEDHMSNTAIQSALYDLFKVKKPLFYHMPIICNQQGQKLSKRDFGFSLQELIQDGYLPEAIANYLILLGNSFEPEIFSLEEAAKMNFFDKIHSTGTIQYSIEKLAWINKKWMARIDFQSFFNHLKPFLIKEFPDIDFNSIDKELLALIKVESENLKDVCRLLKPFLTTIEIQKNIVHKELLTIIEKEWNSRSNYEDMARIVKEYISKKGILAKEAWSDLRLVLTGSDKGLSIKDIIRYLEYSTIIKRISLY